MNENEGNLIERVRVKDETDEDEYVHFPATSCPWSFLLPWFFFFLRKMSIVSGKIDENDRKDGNGGKDEERA